VLRRFTFKIELRPPTLDQAVRLFLTLFEPLLDEPGGVGSEGAVRAAFTARRPTPGDLAAVRRRILSLGMRPNLHQVLDDIRTEVRARSTARASGFVGAVEGS
jgi:hypothetical protein